MKIVTELLRQHPQVSDYKINIHNKESFELFFVLGKLETVRRTDTCDKEVTVYVDHGDFKGDSQFRIYPSTTTEQLRELIDESVTKALLINNQTYTLPAPAEGDYVVESNFSSCTPMDLASTVAETVFSADAAEHASLNSVEIFINKHTETICNSRGLHKTQVRYDAMVEAIPTYNGEAQSVELYEQYNFSSLNTEELSRETAGKLAEVKARCEAVTPDTSLNCPVVLNRQELSELFWCIADDLNYATVYSHSNLWNKGDAIQKAPTGDRISIRMAGEVPGSTRSAKFDIDGMALGSIQIVEDGKAVNHYGSNRFGQYLGETPTGDLRCICVAPGTLEPAMCCTGPCLEVISMSGLQVDFYNDYIGGEIRLAYYHDSEKTIPVTGISISGSLEDVLNHIRLSSRTTVYNGYSGPDQAVFSHMKIF